MKQNNKYLLLQTSIGDYRQKVISLLENQMKNELQIACGNIYFDNTTKTRINFKHKEIVLKNSFFLNRRVLFQIGATWKAIKSDNVILELNPRIINTWFIAIVRRVMLKPIIMWGHAWPRAGSNAKSDRLRQKLRSLATHLVVYTETQKNELEEKYPRLRIIVAPNSLYLSKDMFFNTESKRNDFIFVGRLVSSKKPLFLVQSFIEFIEQTNNSVSKLIIVGEGLEKEIINKFLSKNPKFLSRVLLKGHISDMEQLRKLYATVIASVSPGYVGLSITQSFSFGVPMVISQNENHAPEIEAAEQDFNSFFFETNNQKDLANKLTILYQKKSDLAELGIAIVKNCQKKYSADIMAKRLELALRMEVELSPDNRKSYSVKLIRTIVRKVRKLKLKLKLKAFFTYGNNCYWGKNAQIESPNFFKLKNNFSAGANFFVQTNFKAESDCLISSNVSFVGNDHNFSELKYWSGKNSPSTIYLKGNNFIGFGATLVGNITVGKNSIIGAGSLVLKDVPENTIVGGVPAKILKDRINECAKQSYHNQAGQSSTGKE